MGHLGLYVIVALVLGCLWLLREYRAASEQELQVIVINALRSTHSKMGIERIREEVLVRYGKRSGRETSSTVRRSRANYPTERDVREALEFLSRKGRVERHVNDTYLIRW